MARQCWSSETQHPTASDTQAPRISLVSQPYSASPPHRPHPHVATTHPGLAEEHLLFSLNVRPKVVSITFTHFLLVRIKLHIHGWLQRRLRNVVLSIQLKIRGLIHTEEKRNTCWWPSSNLCDISMASFCSFALPRKPGLCSLLYLEGQVRCVVQTRICTGAINKESPGKHRKQK